MNTNNIRVIQSIQRAIDIINCFNESKQALSINEISNELSLHINTTRGIINTLVYNGYLNHEPIENKYTLGLVFIPKAELVSLNSVDRIKAYVNPYLVRIANKYQVSARLQLISSQFNIFTVDTENPENARYLLLTRIDRQFPLNATFSGKLYLYYSDKEKRENYLNDIPTIKYTDNTIVNRPELEKQLLFIEKNGYSIENEEIGVGISSIAVPLFNQKNTFIGTISITAINSIIEKILLDVINEMKEISKEIKENFDQIL